ncbi:MAG: flagellar biosynthetic protein FliO [Treponema sp.]|nr:flagellar biosynthetic protein FliO [Treponema sp.]
MIGLLIQTQIISAQEGNLPLSEEPEVQEISEESLPIEDPHRIAEQLLTFDDSASGTGMQSGVSAWAIIRMILVLAIVAAAIYGIVFLFKKATRQTSSNDPFLKVLANTHLGANRYAQIVAVGSKAWLVGSSEGGVNLISEIEDKEIIDAMLLEESRKAQEAPNRFPDFLSILQRLGVRAPTQTPGADDIRRRRERLKGL